MKVLFARFKYGKFFYITALLIIALITLNLSTILNGSPFVFFKDTATYLNGGGTAINIILGIDVPYTTNEYLPEKSDTVSTHFQEKLENQIEGADADSPINISAARSIYYSVAVAVLGTIGGGITFIAFAQSVMVLYAGYLFLVSVFRKDFTLPYIYFLFLAIFTPIGFFTGVLLPDFMAGLSALSLSVLLIYSSKMQSSALWGWSAILTFSMLSHNTHFAMVVIVFVITVPLLMFFRYYSWRGIIAIIIACLVCFTGNVMFHLAVKQVYGSTPKQFPMIASSILTEEPGRNFLEETCPQNGYVYCQFLDSKAKSSNEYLWSKDSDIGAYSLADSVTQLEMSNQQFSLLIDVFKFDAFGQISVMAKRFATQLTSISLKQFDPLEKEIKEFLPKEDAELVLKSKVVKKNFPMIDYLEWVYEVIVFISLIVMVASLLFIFLSMKYPLYGDKKNDGAVMDIVVWVLIVIFAIAINAAITGVFSEPQGRYQARVIWLVPFCAVVFLLTLWRSKYKASQ